MDWSKGVLPVLYLLALVLLGPMGCVTDPSPKFTDDIDSLKRQVWSLEKQTAEVNLRLAQNNNEVSLLGEKVKRLEEAVNGLKDAIVKSSGLKTSFSSGGDLVDFGRTGDGTPAAGQRTDY